MLKSKQVDLSMLFPEPNVAEGHPMNSVPVFLSGEKRQAVRTSTPIPPVKTVEKVKKDCNNIQLQNYLYVTFHLCDTVELTPSRSKYSVDLSKDLDDAAVSLLIEHGLGSRFSTVCHAWKTRNAENKEAARKSIFEGKQRVDEELKNSQPQLEDMLAREVSRRILDTYPYVFLRFVHKDRILTLM